MKKFMLLLLALLMLVLTTACGSDSDKSSKPTQSKRSNAYVIGDADGDGRLSVLDATRIQRHLAGLTPNIAPQDMQKAIVSGSGELSVLDATLIQRYLVGLIKQFPVEETAAPTEASQAADAGATVAAATGLQLRINDTAVTVEWEDNEAVAALKEALKGDTLTVDTKNYGDFEQVGPLGMDLPQNDENIDAVAGDVVLFEGNHIVVFYGENNWEYTPLGKITDKDADELAAMLSDETAVLTLLG